jgi:hypothetical protein
MLLLSSSLLPVLVLDGDALSSLHGMAFCTHCLPVYGHPCMLDRTAAMLPTRLKAYRDRPQALQELLQLLARGPISDLLTHLVDITPSIS